MAGILAAGRVRTAKFFINGQRRGLLPGIGYIAARLQIVSLGTLAFRVIYVASTLQ
jgi:hypothetical protein